jgi:hypothetical protein
LQKYFKFLKKLNIKILRQNPQNTEIVFTWLWDFWALGLVNVGMDQETNGGTLEENQQK